MKKFFVAVFVFMSIIMLTKNSYAVEYSTFWKANTLLQNYWQDDKNYPLVWAAHSGLAWYLDKNSIKVEVSDPPYYIISAKTIFVLLDSKASYYDHSPHTPERDNLNSYRFFYDEEEMDMRLDSKADNWELFFGTTKSNKSTANWILLYPPLNWGLSGTRPVCVGEAVFYVSQGRKFYGDYLWDYVSFDSGTFYNDIDYSKRYVQIFQDGFYENLK